MPAYRQDKILRYSRQTTFFGKEKQNRLEKSTAAVVGLGSVGSAAAEYLARAGVSLKLIDRDIVEESNLNRQLYEESDVGKPKASSLAARLKKINGAVSIEHFCDDFNSMTAGKLLVGADIVVDGLDNFRSRFVLNDACMKLGIPFVFSAVIEDKGMVSLIMPGKTPCLSCIFSGKTSNETCETAGIMPPAAGLIGAVSAGEAIKYIAGIGTTLEGKLLSFSLLDNRAEIMAVKKLPDCGPCKGEYGLQNFPEIQRLCSDSYYFSIKPVDLKKLKSCLEKNPDFAVSGNREFLSLVHRNSRITVFRHSMIVKNVSSAAEAKTIAGRIVGL